ncbi:MAG: hypothetical protein FWG65_04500 [Turicibacter sp.]|nr:hypothetical protein [Turicibacter sp.]
MSKKRVAAREWKQKKKRQTLITKLSIVAVCVLLTVGAVYVGWDIWSRTYIMTFNGERISTNYLRFFNAIIGGFGGGIEEDPMLGVNELVNFLVLRDAAERHNLELTEEDRESALSLLGMLTMFGTVLPNIPESSMIEMIAGESYAMQLTEIYTEDFVIDEEQFEEFSAQYIAEHWIDHMDMTFRVYESNTINWAIIGRSDLVAEGPEAFDDLILQNIYEFTGIPVEELEVPTTTLLELREETGIAHADALQLGTLEVGDISQPIQVAEDSFLVLIVDEVSRETDEEIDEFARLVFSHQERTAIFSEILQGWWDDSDISFNERAFNFV